VLLTRPGELHSLGLLALRTTEPTRGRLRQSGTANTFDSGASGRA
jgi:hypothetical protein